MNGDNDPVNGGKSKCKNCSCTCTDRYWREFLEDNTIAGISHVFKGQSKVRRSFWALIFIAAIISCIALISLSIQIFLNKPTASTINVITLDGVPFPSVTICNINFEKNENLPLLSRTYTLMNQLFNADESFHSNSMNASSVIASCRNTVPRNNSDATFEATIWNIQRPARSKRRLIHYCGFVTGVNSNVSDCKSLFEPVLTPAGICFNYNGSSHTIHSTGTRYGMKLVLNIEQDLRPSYNGKAGVILSVHDGKDVARPNVNGINVGPGQAIDVGVNLKEYIDKTNEANCTEGQDLVFFEEYDYSQYACAQNALIEQIAKPDICNCTLLPGRPSNGEYDHLPNCTFPTSCCLLNQYKTINTEEQCPLPCRYKYYDHTTSYASYPNSFILEDLMRNQNITEEDLRKNYLSINIYINDLRYTVVTTSYTFGVEGLLGDIGGQLGLFIGVSIITFFEVLILCLDELKRICCPDFVTNKCKKMKKKGESFDINAGERETRQIQRKAWSNDNL